jgi:hypothetical protein
MNLKYFEQTKRSANGHYRPSCFVLDDKKLHFYDDREVLLDLTKKMLDQLDHHQVYRIAQKLIKSNHIRAKRETCIEYPIIKDSPKESNSWEINI